VSATIRFRNWWSDFDPQSSFVPRLMQAALESDLEVVRNSKAHVDFEVHSVFCVNNLREKIGVQLDKRSGDPTRHREATLRRDYGIDQKGPATKHVWYTGENFRPPTDWDVTLSFDVDPMLGANWYLPHWAIRLGDLGGQDPRDPFSATNVTLLNPRDPGVYRSKFACVLAGNPHPLRLALLEALKGVGSVDPYGSMFGARVDSKFDLFQEYRFAIVPENDLYPGYVSEKVIEAWLAGCIPIWWGSDPAGYINPKAVINLAEMSVAELITRIAELDSDPNRVLTMMAEPILNRPYDFSACVDFVRTRLLEA
jgi:hypothetical protein